MDEYFQIHFTAKQADMLKYAQDMPTIVELGPSASERVQTSPKRVLPTAALVVRGAPVHTTREIPVAGRGVDVQYTTRPLGPTTVVRETIDPSPVHEPVALTQNVAGGSSATTGEVDLTSQVQCVYGGNSGAERTDNSTHMSTAINNAVVTWATAPDTRSSNLGNNQPFIMQRILSENQMADTRLPIPSFYQPNTYNGAFVAPPSYSQIRYLHISPAYYDPHMQAAISPHFIDLSFPSTFRHIMLLRTNPTINNGPIYPGKGGEYPISADPNR